jgi:hypothetical protein
MVEAARRDPLLPFSDSRRGRRNSACRSPALP